MTDLVDAIEGGQAYVNVHTEANPPGEVRGTVEVAPQQQVTMPAETKTETTTRERQ